MPSSFTPNKNLELQATGVNIDTWGQDLNNNVITILDSVLGATLVLPLSSTGIVLTTSQSQNLNYKLTGTLTANINISYPQIGGFFYVNNATTGNFAVTFNCLGNASRVTVPQGFVSALVCDGTTVYTPTALSLGSLPDLASSLLQYLQPSLCPAGSVNTFAMKTAPTGWLECDGSAISRTTYATLFSAVGTTWGSGNGSTTFNIPDFRGQFLRGWDDSRGVDPSRVFASSQLDAFQGHTWRVVGSADSVTGGIVDRVNSSGGSLNNSIAGPFSDGTNGTPRVADETRPVNYAVLFCIKY